MYKALIIWLFFSLGVYAHQADVSTTMLVEKENGAWILQVSAALTAFQYEIKANYPDQEYKTPEEFKEMVISHLKKNLSFVFNDGTTILLKNAHVILGHETKVVFEVIGVPENIKNVVVTNSSFNGIHKNQSKLLLFKNGFQKEVFTLNDANNNSLILKAEENKFIEMPVNKEQRDYTALYNIAIVALILGIGNYFWMTRKEKKTGLKVV